MDCLFGKFHTEGTFAVKYKAAQTMAVPFINSGTPGNDWKCVGICGQHNDGAGGVVISIYCTFMSLLAQCATKRPRR